MITRSPSRSLCKSSANNSPVRVRLAASSPNRASWMTKYSAIALEGSLQVVADFPESSRQAICRRQAAPQLGGEGAPQLIESGKTEGLRRAYYRGVARLGLGGQCRRGRNENLFPVLLKEMHHAAFRGAHPVQASRHSLIEGGRRPHAILRVDLCCKRYDYCTISS